ncbi:alpha/beta fold hydrolase [Phytomonospora endophytica]|uniref:Pimeloyl-ACP methyl ester carboxylesterase n=1 Tax=Phytomonospora endophytica TaxID=714109 RepID=A0A841FKA5_9ACTN|nr:alpha/beta hydrolase [Phytomonospora endophytica]MBB6036304.1 pimeloyl-ACP methyl ester carboxylesterase [Phytomonospora endophytica]
MTVRRTSHGAALEEFVTGSGEPVTLFAHGLAGSITTTRPFASGVTGTKVFFHARGHGGSSRGPMTYEGLAADLREVADAHDATRALGVSMGAGTLLRVVAETPGRFERLVLVLPAVVAGPRGPEAAAYWERVFAAEPAELAALLAEEVPPEAREAARPYVGEQVAALTGRRGRRMFGEIAADSPLADAASLKAVDVPVLLIGTEGDPRHPAEVTRRLAEALPNATAHVFGEPGLLWRYRTELRERISGFLNATG